MNESDQDGVVVISVVCQADFLCNLKRRLGRETGEGREKRRVSSERFDSTGERGNEDEEAQV